MKVWLCSVCLCLLPVVGSAQTAFDGQWNGQAGNENLTFTFTTDEGKVSGTVALEGGEDTTIEWGFVKSDLITFRVMRVFQGAPAPFVYVGKVEGDQIEFGRRPEDLTRGRLREFTATRVR